MPPEHSEAVKVTCIMPTADRRRVVRRSIKYFQAQDYLARELLIIDDGVDSIADLVPVDSRIRYIRLDTRLPLGAKRNLACSEAGGDIIVHWDDDDWIAPWRLSYQVSSVIQADADICGLNKVFFYDPAVDQAWQYIYPPGEPFWVAGGTLCYKKSFWKRNPFPSINVAEDTRFVWESQSPRMIELDDPRFYVATNHAGNTSPRRTGDPRYRPVPAAQVRDLMGEEDWRFYADVFRGEGA